MQKIIEGKPLTFERVVSKKPVGVRHVYDIEVHGVHNYYANGINVHNCNFHKCLDHASEKYGIEVYRKKDEFIKYYHKGLRFYPSNPQSQTLRGDCLTGNTLINTSAGFVHFAELDFKKGLHPTDDVIDTPEGQRKVSHTYKKVDREIIKVTTKNGFELKGTPEHPVLVLTPELEYKWRRLDALVEGDYIVSKTTRNQPLFGNTQITMAQATILGTFTANGYRSSVSSNDELVINSFTRAIKTELGIKVDSRYPEDPSIRAADHHVLGATMNGTRVKFSRVLESWGYKNVKSAKKEIPFTIRTAPQEILHEYLEAYFACDCGINGGSTRKARLQGASTGLEIELSSASQKLMRQLQVILLQVYNLVGRLRKRTEVKSMNRNSYTPREYITWTLTLAGHDANLFLQTFKRAKAQKYSDRAKDTVPGVGSDRREVPYVRQHLYSLFKKAGAGHTYVVNGEKRRKPARPFFLWRTGSTAPVPEGLLYAMPDNMAEFLEATDSVLGARLGKLLELGAHYEQVKDIKRVSGKRTVYDVTVPKGHAFTANGLSSHNTRLLSCIDELGLFPLPDGNDEEDETSGRANADEAHKSLSNSLVTMQSVHQELLNKGMNCPPALMMGVSSPISMKDKVMRLLAESRTDEGKKYILGVNLPTWKVNPFLEKTSPLIAKSYASNAEKAERDFGANPPRVSQSYIKPGQVPLSLFTTKQTHKSAYQYDLPGLIYSKVQCLYKPKFPSVVALDAGFSNNSFSLVGGHFNFDTHKTVVTTILEVMTHDGRKIDFNSVYTKMILPIIKDLNAVLLLADQWQSLDILSRAREDMGIAPNKKARCASKQFSPRRRDFDSLVSMLENGNLVFPHLSKADYEDVCNNYIDFRTLREEPVKHLLLQMLTVRETDARSAPTKGEGFTDDIFRALCLLTKLHDTKVMERLKEARGWMKEEGKSGMPIPAYVSYTGMSF